MRATASGLLTVILSATACGNAATDIAEVSLANAPANNNTINSVLLKAGVDSQGKAGTTGSQLGSADQSKDDLVTRLKELQKDTSDSAASGSSGSQCQE